MRGVRVGLATARMGGQRPPAAKRKSNVSHPTSRCSQSVYYTNDIATTMTVSFHCTPNLRMANGNFQHVSEYTSCRPRQSTDGSTRLDHAFARGGRPHGMRLGIGFSCIVAPHKRLCCLHHQFSLLPVQHLPWPSVLAGWLTGWLLPAVLQTMGWEEMMGCMWDYMGDMGRLGIRFDVPAEPDPAV